MRKRPPVRKTSTLAKKHFVALNTKPSMVWDEERVGEVDHLRADIIGVV